MIANAITYLGCAVLLMGAAFCVVAAIGVVRLPDLLSRMHAASKAGAVGGGLVLLAVALLSFDAAIALRAIVGIVFILITTPLAAHLLARASYRIIDQSRLNMIDDELKSKQAEDVLP